MFQQRSQRCPWAFVTFTVAKGTKSAGRIYDKVGDKFYAKVCFVTDTSVIVEVLKRDENNHKNNRKIHK